MTGISRSGRVRKKSSKLMDFESPDSYHEIQVKRQKVQHSTPPQQLFENNQQPPQQQQLQKPQPLENSPVKTPIAIGNGSKQRNTKPMTPQKVKNELMSDQEAHSTASESGDEATGTNEEEQFSIDSVSDDEVDPL